MQYTNNALKNLETQIANSMQHMTFNPSIDLRNDLINFYNFSPIEVANMSDDQVFSIIDNMDNEYPESKGQITNIPCNKCDCKQSYEKDYSDHTDCYTMECVECKNEMVLHYCSYDAILEQFEEMQQENLNDLRSINEFDLSERALKCLLWGGYEVAQEVKNASYMDMVRLRNMSRKVIAEIEEVFNVKFN